MRLPLSLLLTALYPYIAAPKTAHSGRGEVHQCRVESDNPFSLLASYAGSDADQDMFGPLVSWGMLLTHIQLLHILQRKMKQTLIDQKRRNLFWDNFRVLPSTEIKSKPLEFLYLQLRTAVLKSIF